VNRLDSSSEASGGSHGRATIADVAQLSGVSTTTVSHVLTGKRPVSAATQDRVRAAVHELGYQPNHVARNLRIGSSQMVAVVVPDITNPFYSQLVRGVTDALGATYAGYVCSTDGSAARERTFVEDAVARGVDGIVISTADPGAEPGPLRFNRSVPMVNVGGGLDEPEVDLVVSADEDGSYAAVHHLLSRGAERIAMITGPHLTAANRMSGYRRALADAGKQELRSLVVTGDFTRAGGRAAMTRLMRGRRRPDAVFCANDLTAIGALDAARELGLKVPQDVRVVGFDDIDAASLVSPALTTVANPAYESGWSAGGLLNDRLRGRHSGPRRTLVLPCRLIVRETSGPAID
jgi:LacI family transcriptional regulator